MFPLIVKTTITRAALTTLNITEIDRIDPGSLIYSWTSVSAVATKVAKIARMNAT